MSWPNRVLLRENTKRPNPDSGLSHFRIFELGLSSGQSGKIAEYFLVCALMSASGGLLSPFLPASDDHGVDLIVANTKTADFLGIQVKSWTVRADTKRHTVQFDVRKATYLPTSRLALAALVFDPLGMAMQTSWLLPMDMVPSLSTESADKFALTPSTSPTSADRYSAYRHDNVPDLVRAVSRLMGTA